ncbi:hypothetical protein CEUSTIGMA_g9469.t1 [Chlamydomonas eustigma]|uniref:Uncharacterized protein n=1 Tax=Chlamydomonas eustigma TaxID=1157962 RepID=A0A250XG41_9CHLO|nr:hypothetical protein CEUSTIGMA_g9469.t1 [Chlamydomonas eustigma]|eukprot:GAX82041.1 hypothetical protein CEUSTIGMA_g9469.t1 [Chlamydomonas eustigma]
MEAKNHYVQTTNLPLLASNIQGLRTEVSTNPRKISRQSQNVMFSSLDNATKPMSIAGSNALYQNEYPSPSAALSNSGIQVVPAEQQQPSADEAVLFPIVSHAKTPNVGFQRSSDCGLDWPFLAPLQVPVAEVAKQIRDPPSYTNGGYDLDVVDQYLQLLVNTTSQSLVTSHLSELPSGSKGSSNRTSSSQGELPIANKFPLLVPGPFIAMERLGLDPSALKKAGIRPHLINRLYRALHANASAFSKVVLAEQERLAAMAKGAPCVPMSDRLLAYIMGIQAPLTESLGAVGPLSVDEAIKGLIHASDQDDTEEAVSSNGIGPQVERNLVEISSAHATPGRLVITPTDREELLSAGVVMNVEEVMKMASSGNIVGLTRLLGQYRTAHVLAEESLKNRLKHEAARALRLQEQLDMRVEELEVSLTGGEETQQALSEKVVKIEDLELRIIALREEVMNRDDQISSLRLELEVMEDQWSAQLADAASRVSEQLEALQKQSEGQLDLREEYLAKIKEVVNLQLMLDKEVRRSEKLGAELETFKSAARKSSEEAADHKSWLDRFENRAKAAEDVATAAEAKVLDAMYLLAKERADHRKSKVFFPQDVLTCTDMWAHVSPLLAANVHSIRHQVEQARCHLVEYQSKAVYHITKLQKLYVERSERVEQLEGQLQDAEDLAKMRTFEAETAKAFRQAAKDQVETLMEYQKETEAKRIHAEKDAAMAKQQLEEAQEELSRTKGLLKGLQGDCDSKEARLQGLEDAEREKDAISERMEMLSSSLQKLGEEHDELKKIYEETSLVAGKLAPLERAHEKLMKEHKHTHHQYMLLTTKNGAATQGREVAHARVNELEGELDQTKKLLEAKHKKLMEVATKLSDTKQQLAKTREDRDLIVTKLNMTNSVIEKLQVHTSELRTEASKLNLLKLDVQRLEEEIVMLKEGLRLSDQAMVHALSDRDWYSEARQHLSAEMKVLYCGTALRLHSMYCMWFVASPELISAAQGEAQELRDIFEGVQTALSGLQTQMLSLGQDADGGASTLQAQDPSLAREVSEGLGGLLLRVSKLLTSEKSNREKITSRIQSFEEQVNERLNVSTPFWDECLASARKSPGSLATYMISVGNLQLDPLSPLASLVPVGLLEKQSLEIGELKAQLGAAKGVAEVAVTKMEAATVALDVEKEICLKREETLRDLVRDLRAEIKKLKSDLSGSAAARQIQERLTSQLGRKLKDAEYVADRTIYSELWVRAPPATFEEASRRASTLDVPTWGADVGSGSVPKPSMAVLASRSHVSDSTRPGTSGSSYGTRPGTSGSGAAGWPWGGASAWGSRPGTSGTQRSSSPPQQAFAGTSPDIWIAPSEAPQNAVPYLTPTQSPNSAFGFPASIMSSGANSKLPSQSRPSTSQSMSSAITNNRAAIDSSTMTELHVVRPVSALPVHKIVDVEAAAHMTRPMTSPAVGSGRSRGMSRDGNLSEWRITSHGSPIGKAFQGQEDHKKRRGAAHRSRQDSASSLTSTAATSALPFVEWDWMSQVKQLTEQPPPLSIPETLDLISSIYIAKVRDDASATSAGRPPQTLPQFVGAFSVHEAAGWLDTGVEAVQWAAQLVSSIQAHAAASYEIQVFGRHVGLLQQQQQQQQQQHGSKLPSSAHKAVVAAATEQPPMVSCEGARPVKESAPHLFAKVQVERPMLKRGMSAGFASHLKPDSELQHSPGKALSPSMLRPHRQPLIPGDAASRGQSARYPVKSVAAAAAARSVMANKEAWLLGTDKSIPELHTSANLISPELSLGLQKLMQVSGMDTLLRFISSGQFAGQLTSRDLGTSIHESILPGVHFLLADICRCLNIEICPELIEMEELQGDFDQGNGRSGGRTRNDLVDTPPAYLLVQLPHSLTPVAEIEPQLPASVLRHTSPSRPGSPDQAQYRAGGGGPQLSWRRRALVLLRPGLLSLSPPLEAQALLAMALAPMALPGGGGWRMSLVGHGSSSTSSPPEHRSVSQQVPAAARLEGGRDQGTHLPEWTWPSPAAGEAVPSGAVHGALWPAVADVATAASLGVVRPEAMAAQLPLELQVKWPRLIGPLRHAMEETVTTCDRLALLAVQRLGPVLRAMYRTTAGVIDGTCPSAEELEGMVRQPGFLKHEKSLMGDSTH